MNEINTPAIIMATEKTLGDILKAEGKTAGGGYLVVMDAPNGQVIMSHRIGSPASAKADSLMGDALDVTHKLMTAIFPEQLTGALLFAQVRLILGFAGFSAKVNAALVAMVGLRLGFISQEEATALGSKIDYEPFWMITGIPKPEAQPKPSPTKPGSRPTKPRIKK